MPDQAKLKAIAPDTNQRCDRLLLLYLKPLFRNYSRKIKQDS
ncbi:hypothetical protein [Nostoc sp. DedQUE07]|nr:hypothetical protein [Nostoc sp. DedQUE07]MDZ8133189.1 hypothetical protein [Nostoc sp. DedQUE07]